MRGGSRWTSPSRPLVPARSGSRRSTRSIQRRPRWRGRALPATWWRSGPGRFVCCERRRQVTREVLSSGSGDDGLPQSVTRERCCAAAGCGTHCTMSTTDTTRWASPPDGAPPTGLVNRVIGWADDVQRRHGVLGFPWAVIKKYGDDDGGRAAALITYYGFLSVFPLLLLGVAIVSRVLAGKPELSRRLVTAIVPSVLRSTVEDAFTALPASTVPFIAGLIGLVFAGTGVVFSAYQTLNDVAAVPRRLRLAFFPRYLRVFVMLMVLVLGAVAVGALTVAATALPTLPEVGRVLAVVGSALIIFV